MNVARHAAQSTKPNEVDGDEWLRRAIGLENGQKPFPWQLELLRRFRHGAEVQAIDIPTGLGKTATMAIWLVARALGAKLPRRLVYVVDRRAVVDQATEVAEALRKWVAREKEIADKLGLGDRVLPISTLRGQHVDNREWLEDPSSPAIVVGTIDMIGSQLLFSGYGVSSKMRPYRAGLLGADALVVLDEAHLVPSFENLLRRIESGVEHFGPSKHELFSIVPTFKLLSLSATARVTVATALTLSEDDRTHPVIKERLAASKTLATVTLGGRAEGGGEEKEAEGPTLPGELAAQAWKLTNDGTAPVRCLVFCDARKDATAVAQELRKLATSAGASEPVVELFVGARRVRERNLAREALARLGFLADSSVDLEHAAFLIATSAGEVGVDLDADHLVCDLVAWERMVQRLGRVNRRGGRRATVIVVAGAEPTPSEAIKKALEKRDAARDADNRLKELQVELQRLQAKEQRRPKSTRPSTEDKSADDARKQRVKELKSEIALLQRRITAFRDDDAKAAARHERDVAHAKALRTLLRAVGEGGDLSPASLVALKAREDLRDTLRDAASAQPLRPALTRALIDAWSMTSLDDHPGRPEVDPWLRGWRPSEPPQTSIVWRRHLPVRDDGGFEPGAARLFFEAAPPHTSELLEAETFRAIEWLAKRSEAAAAENEAESHTVAIPLRDSCVAAIALTRHGEVKKWWTLGQLRTAPGKEGKQAREQLEADLTGTVLVVDSRLGGLTEGLLDDNASTAGAADDGTTTWLTHPDDGNVPVAGFRIRRLQRGSPDDDIAASRAVPREGWVRRHVFVAAAVDGEPTSVIVIDGWSGESATEDDRAEASDPQQLDQHQDWAADCAKDIGRRVGLREDYRALLVLAARLHDEGKRATRWQRAFRAPRDGVAYAKTRGPIDFALLDGYRHELGSLSYVDRDPQFQALANDAQQLVLHLIASHHGYGRPVIGTGGCDDAPPSAVEARAREVALRFARLQRRWGPWGLAWWEALMRSVDQAASRCAQKGRSPIVNKEHV